MLHDDDAGSAREGSKGERCIQACEAYDFDSHHDILASLCSVDLVSTCPSAEWILLVVYGNVKAASKYMREKQQNMAKIIQAKAASQTWVIESMCV